ncbi:MAG: cache domain-containing protein, partial [Planctomycetota bacterium]
MRWNDIPLKIKLNSLFLLMSLVPLILVGFLAYNRASSALGQQAFNQLTSIREAKGKQIESCFQQIHDQILTLSESHMISNYAANLKKAFWAIDQNISDSEYKRMEASVKNYYQSEYLSRLNKNLDRARSVSDYWPADRESVILQYNYLSNNPNPTGEKHNLNNANDGSEYSKLHTQNHPVIRNYLEKFGYYDIFLADPDTGNIFYTVFKEVDYTTSLLSGPYKKTKFATAFKKAVEAGKAGIKDFVAIVDFEPYDPSYHAPASFTASPVFTEEGEFVAVLMFQMPVDNINNIMTGNEGWEADGLGKSGETYLVGSDYKMRSISRFFLQDKEGMTKILNDIDYDNSMVEQMDRVGTTIGLMKVQTEASERALKGEMDTKIIDDYRGIPVLSSFRKLAINGLDWILLSEIDEGEAFEPVKDLRNIMLVICLIVTVIVSMTAYFVVKSITRPIQAIETQARSYLDTGFMEIKAIETIGSNKDEIGQLGKSLAAMLTK